MKAAIAFLLTLVASSPAQAEEACDYGAPGILTFVDWTFERVDARWVKINLTIHNNLETTVKKANIRVAVDGKHFLFRARETAPPSGDVLVTDQVGIPAADSQRFQGLTPQLCVEWTEDENDAKTKY